VGAELGGSGWRRVSQAMAQEGGTSRGAPAPFGSEVVSGNLGITVVEVIRGDEALTQLKAVSPLNPDPPADQEFVLARLRVRHTGDGDPVDINLPNIRLTASGNVLYPPQAPVLPPEPQLEYTLDPGDEREGWVALRVGQDETHRQVVYVFEPHEQFERWRFLAIEDDAVLPAAPPTAPEPNEVGVTRDQPTPLGEMAVTPYFAVQVLEGVRGAEALDKIRAAESSNAPPAEGNQYVLLKMRVTSRVAEEIPVFMSPAEFAIVGKAAEPYFSGFPYPVVPEPSLYAHLYPGGTLEGWMAFEIGADEDSPVLGHMWLGDPEGEVRFFAIP
jgi:hypothetical protein